MTSEIFIAARKVKSSLLKVSGKERIWSAKSKFFNLGGGFFFFFFFLGLVMDRTCNAVPVSKILFARTMAIAGSSRMFLVTWLLNLFFLGYGDRKVSLVTCCSFRK